MRVVLDVPEYSSTNGMKYKWEEGFDISVKVEDNEVRISANTAGLISLANQLLVLAQKDVPNGSHIHLDEFNSLNENSNELILEKI